MKVLNSVQITYFFRNCVLIAYLLSAKFALILGLGSLLYHTDSLLGLNTRWYQTLLYLPYEKLFCLRCRISPYRLYARHFCSGLYRSHEQKARY